MTLNPGERLRRLWDRRRDPRERSPRDRKRELEVFEEIAPEFTTEELQEFLEADKNPVEASPAFKEELRERLWKMLEERRLASGEE